MLPVNLSDAELDRLIAEFEQMENLNFTQVMTWLHLRELQKLIRIL